MLKKCRLQNSIHSVCVSACVAIYWFPSDGSGQLADKLWRSYQSCLMSWGSCPTLCHTEEHSGHLLSVCSGPGSPNPQTALHGRHFLSSCFIDKDSGRLSARPRLTASQQQVTRLEPWLCNSETHLPTAAPGHPLYTQAPVWTVFAVQGIPGLVKKEDMATRWQ